MLRMGRDALEDSVNDTIL